MGFSPSLFLTLKFADRNADLCDLILYPATSLNSSFLVVFWWSFKASLCIIRSFTKIMSFTSQFTIGFPFLLFSSLIVLFWAPKTIFKGSGQNRHSCLVLKGKAFSFAQSGMVLAMNMFAEYTFKDFLKVLSISCYLILLSYPGKVRHIWGTKTRKVSFCP